MAPVGGKRRLLLDPSDGNNRATLSLPPLLRPPETQSSASGSASGSHQVGVTASSSTPESAAPPTIATGTSQTIEIDADVDTIDDHDEHPVKRKKLTSEVWQYFNKVKVSIEENGKIYKQEWAHCKFKKCPYKGRCESTTGTSGFWSHLKSHHSIVKGQQQLKAEKDKEKGIDVVEPYKYDEEASLRKLYVATIMHEYPFNMVEHEYFRDFITSLRPNFPLKSRVTVRKEILNIYM